MDEAIADIPLCTVPKMPKGIPPKPEHIIPELKMETLPGLKPDDDA